MIELLNALAWIFGVFALSGLLELAIVLLIGIIQSKLGIMKVWWSEEDDCYIDKSNKYPGIMTHGNTPEEAEAEMDKVLAFINEEEIKQQRVGLEG